MRVRVRVRIRVGVRFRVRVGSQTRLNSDWLTRPLNAIESSLFHKHGKENHACKGLGIGLGLELVHVGI